MPRRSRQKTDDEGRNKPNRLSYMLPKKRFETINAAYRIILYHVRHLPCPDLLCL